MKKLIFTLLILTVFSIPAYAQMGMGSQPVMPCGMMGGSAMGEQKSGMQQGMMMGEGMPMMQNMMGQQMMMKDVMQMMMDMLKMQKMITKGMGAGDKKDMMKDMDRMMDRMNRMMSDMNSMMMKGTMGSAPVEPKGEEKKQSPEKGVQPKADPHKH